MKNKSFSHAREIEKIGMAILAAAVLLLAIAAIVVWLCLDRDRCPIRRTGQLAALAEPAPAMASERELLRFNAEKNELANDLMRSETLADGLVGQLSAMYRDTGYDECWRDYCLQFLGSALCRGDVEAMPEKDMAVETLLSALDDRQSTFAGTALISLLDAARASGDARLAGLVGASALEIAANADYSDASRTTALMIAEELYPRRIAAVASRVRGDSGGLLAETAAAILRRAKTVRP